MAIPGQTVHIDVKNGIDTKTDDKLVVPGRLVELENGIFEKAGSIVKRNGYDAIPSDISGGGSITNGVRLSTRRDELVLFDIDKAYSYSESLEKWVDRGSVTSMDVSFRPIQRNDADQTLADMAANDNIEVYAWTDSRDGVRSTVVDTLTGLPILSDQLLDATGSSPRVAEFGDRFVVVYIDGTDLKARAFDVDTLTFEAEVTLTPNLNGTFDMIKVGDDWIVAYTLSGTQTNIFYLTDTPAVGSVFTGHPTNLTITLDSDQCLALATTGAATWIVGVSSAGTATVASINSGTFSFLLAPTAMSAGAGPSSADVDRITMVIDPQPGAQERVRMYWELDDAATQKHVVEGNTFDFLAAEGVRFTVARSVGLAHKAFIYDSEVHIGLSFDTTLQSTYFLAREDRDNSTYPVVAKVKSQISGGHEAADGHLPAVSNVADGKFAWAALFKEKFVSELNEENKNVTFTQKGVGRSQYDFLSVDRFKTDILSENLHTTGGLLQEYDGKKFVEAGFNVFPEGFSGTASGSAATIAGDYGIACIYQWIDANGQVHRSAPFFGDAITVSGEATFDFVIPTLRLTDKERVTIELYRTEANGSIYYKLTSASEIENDKTVDEVTPAHTETIPLSGSLDPILSSEILYTTGNVIENIPPPATSAIAVVKNRMWAVDAEERTRIFYSKPRIPGQGVAFSDLLTLQVEPEGGDITAIHEMDDKLVIFKRDNIYIVFGDGPNNIGLGGTFSDPQRVTTDVGCLDQRSVVEIDKGLLFKSSKGIYLLQRNVQVSYAGAMVEGFNGLTISSGVLLDSKNQVRFTTSDGDAIVYDYFFDQWSTFTNHTGVGAVIHKGVYKYLQADGTVLEENPTRYRDINKGYRMRLKTAWIKMAGLQGFQRIRRIMILGEFKSSHTLSGEVSYDYRSFFERAFEFEPDDVLQFSTYGGDATYGASGVYGGVEDDVYQFSTHLARQKCQSIRIAIEDEGADGEAYSIASIALDVGVKKGVYPVSDNKNVPTS